MSEDEDVHDEYSDDDIESIEEEALQLLESKKMIVENADGTFRCPYSPSRKKQSYPYKDLLQHAEGVAKGKRGAEAAGRHMALAKYLKSHLFAKASPKVERVHKLQMAAPERREEEDLLVWPWCGVVYNIDNSKRGENGQRVGIGNSELKHFFKVFHLEKGTSAGALSRTIWALLLYSSGEIWKDLTTLKHLTMFIDNGHGRRDWEKVNERNELGMQLYGWLARKDDYQREK
ncbi:hypothetical protein R1flu_004255 [Riccia fluitans]|uniref:Uncharacterized protein n=1 Tax=Riccia fluitans TaxID=41844 RepID=A0ABD1YPR3_9MARC